jgi:excisionase family DNA binding protein
VSGLCLENRLKAGGGAEQGTADRLLSVKEVAERLGLSTASVYGLCADRRLAHVRILNVIRIAPRDLSSFIDSSRSPAGRRLRS